MITAKNKSWRARFLVLIIISGLLLVAGYYHFLNKPQDWFYSTISPISRGLSVASIKTRSFASFFINIKKISLDNQALRFSNASLLAQTLEVDILRKENKALQQALGYQKDSGCHLILAKIISQPPLAGQQILIVDRGLKQGVRPGQAVLLAPNTFFGQVVESFDNFSRVRVLTDSQSQFQAVVKDREAQGIIKGQGNNVLMLDMIAQDKNIVAGDWVMTVADQQMVSGLIVGQIDQVFKNDLGVFQRALTKPTARFTGTDQLFIVLAK